MEVTEAIRKPRSVRSFTAQAVEEAGVRALIDAAIQAPSAPNAQPWRSFRDRAMSCSMGLLRWS